MGGRLHGSVLCVESVRSHISIFMRKIILQRTDGYILVIEKNVTTNHIQLHAIQPTEWAHIIEKQAQHNHIQSDNFTTNHIQSTDGYLTISNQQMDILSLRDKVTTNHIQSTDGRLINRWTSNH
jgi:hypothetical protein